MGEFFMKKTISVMATATMLGAMLMPAIAQQSRNPTTERDVLSLSLPILPVPDNRTLIIPFSETMQFYFKMPFKGIRLADINAIKAVPQNDHVIAFTGTAPGRTSFTLEGADGGTFLGEIVVVTEVREVKTYTPKPGEKPAANVQNAGVVIVQAPEGGKAEKSAEAEYSARLCNEVGCRPVPQAK